MTNFFKTHSAKNNEINHRIAGQIWSEIAKVKGLSNDNFPAFLSTNLHGIQLNDGHLTDGMSVYIRELDSPHRVLAYPIKHTDLPVSAASGMHLDWAALAKLVDGGRAIVVAGDSIQIDSASVDITLARQNPEYLEMVSRQDEVTERFGPLFRDSDTLTEADFRAFLFFEHNHHWTSLYRQTSNLLEQGIDHLRNTIAILTNEAHPIAERYNDAVARQKGMDKGIATAILIVAFPERYGVWNSKSEAGLIELGAWPELPRGTSDGETYEAINVALRDLTTTHSVDLWSLDGLLHFIQEPKTVPPLATTPASNQGGKKFNGDDVFDNIAKSILATVAASGTVSQRTAKDKPTDMTHDELVAYAKELFSEQSGKCKLTRIPMKKELGGPLAISADRIDSDVGYIRGNIQLTVWAANRAKGSSPDAEFREFIALVRKN